MERFWRTIMTNKLEMTVCRVEGYGSTGYECCRFVWNNKELAYRKGDSFDLGRWSVIEEQKWQRHIDDGTIEEASKDKKQAYRLCDLCNGECRYKCIAQYDYMVCSEACLEKAEHNWHMKHPQHCDHPRDRWNRMNIYDATYQCWDCRAMFSPWPSGKRILDDIEEGRRRLWAQDS